MHKSALPVDMSYYKLSTLNYLLRIFFHKKITPSKRRGENILINLQYAAGAHIIIAVVRIGEIIINNAAV